jgi:hypothetical protein
MHGLDFTVTFHHIGESLNKGQMSLHDHATGQIRVMPIAVDDYRLLLQHNQATPPLLADLTDLATAIHMADRLAKGRRNLPRYLLIRLPIRQLDMLDKPSVHQKLQKLLYWFTEDEWSFEFLPYTKLGRSSELNACLPWLQEPEHQRQVVLWSGGLDAFAGLYQQLTNEPDTSYTLFGTGGNDMIAHTQRRAAVAIGRLFPKRTKLVQLPLRLSGSRSVQKSKSARTRGFVFMLLGAVCASQEGQHALSIFENGVGAFNLPFRASEVGLDHSRSVHPLSLQGTSELLAEILGQPFSLHNPFLFQTKAQMCREPLFVEAANSVFTSTISCDSRHRSRPMQCGYCSSCLLRRQAIAAQGVIDHTPYVITNTLQNKQKHSYGTHYRAMMAQVNQMRKLLGDTDPWIRMAQAYQGGFFEKVAGKMEMQEPGVRDHILRLYQNYVTEWDAVKQIIEPDFLE